MSYCLFNIIRCRIRFVVCLRNLYLNFYLKFLLNFSFLKSGAYAPLFDLVDAHSRTRPHTIEHMRVHALVSRYVLHIRSELALQARFVYTRVFARQAHWRASEQGCVGRTNSKSSEAEGLARAQGKKWREGEEWCNLCLARSVCNRRNKRVVTQLKRAGTSRTFRSIQGRSFAVRRRVLLWSFFFSNDKVFKYQKEI